MTRPVQGAAETSRHLRALGFAPLLAPMLRIVARPGPVHLPGAVAAVAVTSANAVPAIPAALLDGPVFTVGDATARAARAAGCTDVRSADGTAAELADVVAGAVTGPVTSAITGVVLLLAGAGQGGALAAALRRGGIRVVRRVAYEAVPVDGMPIAVLDALRAGGVHGAVFMSGATAVQFTRMLPGGLAPSLSGVVAACISDGAAAPLRHLPWRRLRVSSKPNLMDTLALL